MVLLNAALFLEYQEYLFWRTDLNVCFYLSLNLWEILNVPSEYTHYTQHKKLSFPLKIYSVNVTKFAETCGFGHIYCGIP